MALSRPLMNLPKTFGFVRNLSTSAARMSGEGGDHAASVKMWKYLSLFVCIPVVALTTYVNFGPNAVHHHRPEFAPYEYMRIRTRAFPWSDGQRTLFHNPVTTPLPDGYEVEERHQSPSELYRLALTPHKVPAE